MRNNTWCLSLKTWDADWVPKMDLPALVDRLRSGAAPKFPTNANSLEFAQSLDAQDSIRHLRDEFILPTKKSLKKKSLDGSIPTS